MLTGVHVVGLDVAAAAADRLKEITTFEERKTGVKGLVDSGITKIPSIFIHPHETLPKSSETIDAAGSNDLQVPVINIGGISDELLRRRIVSEVRDAVTTWGIFQLVNHDVPGELLEEVLKGAKRFHEGDAEEKSRYYGRDRSKKVRFYSNYDLFSSVAATWKDSLTVCNLKASLQNNDLPDVCKNSFVAYKDHILAISTLVTELLSEALGLGRKDLEAEFRNSELLMVCNYYPQCPEPERTIGYHSHKDASFFTILLQDMNGGLQVLQNERWVNVKPIEGALIVNLGDFMQLLSNDVFKSADHRALTNQLNPRVSVAMFIAPLEDEPEPYAPIKQLLSETNPPRYRDVPVQDFYIEYLKKGLDNTNLSKYKL